jgi:hypothetical protein
VTEPHASVSVPAFTGGTEDPLMITATKTDQTKRINRVFDGYRRGRERDDMRPALARRCAAARATGSRQAKRLAGATVAAPSLT